jgi:hypothetical protein
VCFGCVFLVGMASKRRSFEERFSSCASLSSSFSLLDLCSFAGPFGTHTSQWSWRPSGPTAFSHSHAGLRWLACGLHTPRFSFVSACVGHGFLFLVLAGGGDGFRRSAVTRVVFVYNTHRHRQ